MNLNDWIAATGSDKVTKGGGAWPRPMRDPSTWRKEQRSQIIQRLRMLAGVETPKAEAEHARLRARLRAIG